ncbi:MAG: preprotein translocase subunit YajC [Alphaproteobacteria bacterium HGW-Alphaproteobacteria-16]|nr:MAG: preprotein translocase subunit YajC [Alphaproteobacteria bacterium HGW-Alphaproteobacteria-16]
MIITPAFAQAAGSAAGQGSTFASFASIAPLILIFVAFYFLMIRPQQKRMKALQVSIGGMKKGDTVVTAGGLVGKVMRVDDQYADVEIATGVKVKVVKATIVEVQPLGGKPAND